MKDLEIELRDGNESKKTVTGSQVSNRVGHAASLDLFNDGRQSAVVHPLAADHFEAEYGRRGRGAADAHGRRMTGGTAAAAARIAHVLRQYHASNHFRAVAIRLPRDRMRRLVRGLLVYDKSIRISRSARTIVASRSSGNKCKTQESVRAKTSGHSGPLR